MKNFKIGDVVQLKSGGPKMTISQEDVNSHGHFSGKIICEWFYDGDVKWHSFYEEELTLAS
ncbi:MAG: DUF2158 domain-containing protein [Bacteroidetes bacterium]|nr:DUF2158 domain-containing protein [Bacteroidota bacterium]